MNKLLLECALMGRGIVLWGDGRGQFVMFFAGGIVYMEGEDRAYDAVWAAVECAGRGKAKA
jgi:hypothetical protein